MEYFMNLKFTNDMWKVILPIVLCILNIITIYIKAWTDKKTKKIIIRKNLGQKLGEICYILVGILIKNAFGINSVMIFIILYICYIELIELLENCTKLGVPIPEIIQEKLNIKDYEKK